jgi:hypothetical protein
MDVDRLREDLAFVDRMIAECQHHIAQLQETATETSRDGQDTGLTNYVLANFTTALTRYEAERNRVVSAIKNGNGSTLVAAGEYSSA